MALSDFTKDLSEVSFRGGGAFVSDDDGVTWNDLGRVKGVQFSWSKVTTDPDTAGRPMQAAADVTVQITLTQTAADQLTNLDLLTNPAGNGLWLKLTEVFTDAAGAGAAAGFTIKNAIFTLDGQIMFDNSESAIPLETAGRVPMTELVKLGSASEITFDGTS